MHFRTSWTGAWGGGGVEPVVSAWSHLLRPVSLKVQAAEPRGGRVLQRADPRRRRGRQRGAQAEIRGETSGVSGPPFC